MKALNITFTVIVLFILPQLLIAQVKEEFYKFEEVSLSTRFHETSRKTTKGYVKITYENDQIICETIQNNSVYKKQLYNIENKEVLGDWSNEKEYQNRAFFLDHKIAPKMVNTMIQICHYNEMQNLDTLKIKISNCFEKYNFTEFKTYKAKNKIVQKSVRVFNSSISSTVTRKTRQIELMNKRKSAKIRGKFEGR